MTTARILGSSHSIYKYSKLLASLIYVCGTFISSLAGPGQKANVLCMLLCPNSQKTSFNWICKDDNSRQELTVLIYILWTLVSC